MRPAAAVTALGLALALGDDTAGDEVGLVPDGRTSIPADVVGVGWYRFGPAPGDTGSAVLAGHVEDGEQGPRLPAPLREGAVGQEVGSYRDDVVVVAEPLR